MCRILIYLAQKNYLDGFSAVSKIYIESKLIHKNYYTLNSK